MRRNLVLARVGRASLHREWVRTASSPRNWDLHLVPYEPLEPQDDLDCSVGEVIPGPKWSGLREALNNWDGWRNYDHLWLPDDDIRASQDVISRMFDVAGQVGLELFAPALDASSHYAHYITMQNPSFYGRWVGFVEIMVPGFSRAALELLLPTLDMTETGWGLDSVWPKLLDYKNVGIIDGTPVTHTRPVGAFRDDELCRRVLQESETLLARFDCRQMHTTFAAFGPDLEPLDLTPERLLVEMVKGTQYLYEQNPGILTWLVAYHLEHFSPPSYPAEGTCCRQIWMTTVWQL